MTKVYSFQGVTPVVHPDAFVHPTAVLIGDVVVGAGSYIGPHAVLRGDFGRLVLHEGVNFQDCCVMHGFPDRESVIEQDGHIGHGAIIHGAHIERNALVGMNAVVMDYARIGTESIVAAMTFVKAQAAIPPRSLVAGIPGKVIRQVTDEEIAWKHGGTRDYQELARQCLATMEQVDALPEEEADRPRLKMRVTEPLSERRS